MSDCTPSPSLSPREGAENDDGALPAVSPTTEGGIHSFHNRLVRIYMAYDPAKAHTVSGTLRKYRGREEAVIQKLVEKYGPEPPYSSSEEMNLSPRPAMTEVSEVSSQPSPRGLTNSFPAPPPLPQSYVERLTSMYAHYDPDKVRLVEGTLRKFRGKEEAVMQQLIKKYGPEPLASPVEVNRTTTSMDGEADSGMASPIALVSSSAAAPSEEVDRSEEAAVDGDAVVAAASEEEGNTTSSDLTPATDYYRTHMMELLQRHEPDKVDMIDELLSKYQGREQEMLDRLTLRFNGPPPTEAEVDEPTAVTMEDASPPPLVAPPPPPIQQHQPGIDVGVQRVGAPTNNTSISRVQLFSVDAIPPPPVVVVVEPPQSPKVEKRAQHTQTVAVAAPRVVQWSRPGLAWITHQAMERHKALLRRYWVLWAAHHNTNTLVRRQVWKAVEGGRRYQMNDHVEPPYVVSRIPLGPRGDGSAFSSSMVAALRKLVDALRQCIRGQVTEMMSAEHRKQAELFLASWSTKKDLAPVRDGEALHRAIVQASMLLGQMKELMAVVKKQAAQLQESAAQRAASDKKVAEMTQFQQHFQQARAVVQELQASLQRAEEEKTSMRASLDAARSSARAASIRPSPITSSSFTPSPAPTPRDATTYAAQRPQWPRSLSSPRPPQHRGLCSTCGSELASCCPETEGPRNKKAAFCFKCRRSFTFGEL